MRDFLAHLISGLLFASALSAGFGVVMAVFKFLDWVHRKKGDRAAWFAFGSLLFVLMCGIWTGVSYIN